VATPPVGRARTPIARGQLLAAAVRELTTTTAVPVAQPADADVDTCILWEVPSADAAVRGSGVYAWLAGEGGVVRGLRRHLLQDAGTDPASVAFMGYWRDRHAETN